MSLRVLLAAASLAVIATPGMAQTNWPYGSLQSRETLFEGRSAAVDTAPACEKLCADDVNPCDPPEFKDADRRCTAARKF